MQGSGRLSYLHDRIQTPHHSDPSPNESFPSFARSVEDADAPDSTWLALHLLLVKQEQGNALQKQLQVLDDSVAGEERSCPIESIQQAFKIVACFRAVCWDAPESC